MNMLRDFGWRYRTRQQSSGWAIPALYIVAAIILGIVIPGMNVLMVQGKSNFDINVATTLLGAVASGMITFTGFVFSMLILMVQFSTSAYSPRLAGYYLRDRAIQHALGMFVATFLFALIALSAVGVGKLDVALELTVIVALVGVLGSVFMFLALIQKVMVLQITYVLHMIGDRGRQAIAHWYPDLLDARSSSGSSGQDRLETGATITEEDRLSDITQSLQYFGRPMMIASINVPYLVRLAESVNGVIELDYPVGDFVPYGANLLDVRGGSAKIKERVLRGAIIMGDQRTVEQDPKYAFRLIVDIAIKALSAALNDPSTAAQAIDQLDDLLRRIGNRRLAVGNVYDEEGALRVIYPAPDWEDYLDLALDEIRYFGADSIQVMRRLHALLEDLLEAVPPERKPLVLHHLERLNTSVGRTFTDLEDREDAGQADRQGIGLTREHDDDDDEEANPTLVES